MTFRSWKAGLAERAFNVALYKPFELLDLTDEKMGYAVQIVLIDGMTGIVHALKLIGLPHEVSKRFKELVEKQRETEIRDYDTVLSQIYSRNRSGIQMVIS